MEEDILNFSPTVMFRGTPCSVPMCLGDFNPCWEERERQGEVYSHGWNRPTWGRSFQMSSFQRSSFLYAASTDVGTLFFIRKCLFVELRHRMIKSRLFLVRNCLLVEFDSIVGSKLIYQSVWRALRMKRQTVSSDMKSKRMIKNEGPLKSALICRIFVS